MSKHVTLTRCLFRTLLFAVMVLGLVLPGLAVAQEPGDTVGGVSLASVTNITVTPDPTQAGEKAQYTITFTTQFDLAQVVGDNIRVTFPDDTEVPDPINEANVTVNGVEAAGISQPLARRVEIAVQGDVPAGLVTVVFELGAGIENPTAAGSYQLKVATSKQTTAVDSAPYTITPPPPVVDTVAPPAANQGEMLEVVITGQNFEDLAPSGVDFGPGIAVTIVASTDTEITVTLDIDPGAAVGERDVTVTTPSGTGTKVDGFEVNAEGTPLVDRYDSAGIWQANYDSIGAAADHAASGDILIAHAATYTSTVESFPIALDADNLTLKSYMGADSTIIDNESVDENAIEITADGITLGGSGFTIKGWDGNACLLIGGADDVTIKNNIFRHNDGGGQGIAIIEGDQVLIDGNAFEGSATDDGITVDYSTNVTVTDNTFSYLGRDGIALYDSTDVTVTDNAFSYLGRDGIHVFASTNLMVTDNVAHDLAGSFLVWDGSILLGNNNGLYIVGFVADNEVSDCDENAVWIISGTVGANTLEIYRNKFYNNGTGILIGEGVVGREAIKINYNDIYGNTDAGVAAPAPLATVPAPVSAEKNWWGHEGGPGGAAMGNGDAVSTGVSYDPWLTETYGKTMADQIRYYGSTLTMKAGWNTLSTPLDLKSGSGKTFGEIMALGSFLDSITIAWSYDAQAGQWVQVGSTTELVPGQGFYILFKQGTSFPVLYNEVMGPLPERQLYAGWNLIGSMFGVDKDADFGIAGKGDANGQMAVNQALASVQNIASVTISPSLPGQEKAWSVLANSDRENMLVGEGYWLYVNADGKLAGWEMTPLYHDPCADMGCN